VTIPRETWTELQRAETLLFHAAAVRHPRAFRALFDGFGGMVSFVVRGGDEAAVRVLGRLRVLRVAPRLGGVESLVSMPRYTSHIAFSREERHALGIDDGFIRVSVGIEDAADLQEDLGRALEPEVK